MAAPVMDVPISGVVFPGSESDEVVAAGSVMGEIAGKGAEETIAGNEAEAEGAIAARESAEEAITRGAGRLIDQG